MKKDAAPKGFTTVTPYLVVHEVEPLIDFLEKAFDAELKFSMPDDNNKITHAEVRVGNSIVMMGRGSEEGKELRSMLYIYTEDCDKYYKKALEAGGESQREPEDQFYGDRTAAISGPMNNIWYIAQAKEEVPVEELQERMKQQSE